MKMVHDKVACEKVVCVCAKDGVCVCVTQWCVTKMCVTKMCVCVLKMVCDNDVGV